MNTVLLIIIVIIFLILIAMVFLGIWQQGTLQNANGYRPTGKLNKHHNAEDLDDILQFNRQSQPILVTPATDANLTALKRRGEVASSQRMAMLQQKHTSTALQQSRLITRSTLQQNQGNLLTSKVIKPRPIGGVAVPIFG